MKAKKQILSEKAQNGDVQAMFELGSLYFLYECKFEKAISWYKKALENGNHDAILWIAKVYEQLDIQKSFKDNSNSDEYELSDHTNYWYDKAFEYYENNYKNNAQNAVTLAELLSDEDAIKIDYKKAFNLYLHAANINDNDIYVKIACERVSKMLENGLGCESNLEKANYYKEKGHKISEL